MKNRILRSILFPVLGLTCLYTGISCIAVWRKAASQPYLMSGTVRFDFMGYYIIAIICGVVCLVSLLIMAFVFFRTKKLQSKQTKH